MRARVGSALLAAVLALTGTRAAWAVWTEYQVTSKSTLDWDRSLRVDVAPESAVFRVRIDLAAKSGKRPLSPFTSAHLTLVQDDRLQGEMPVYTDWDRGHVHLSFKIAKMALDRSRLEIREQGWTYLRDATGAVLRDRHGKPEAKLTLGGEAYWFLLKDFIELENTPGSPRP